MSLQCDVLIVGGGIAGMSAAISAREQGANAVIVSKLHPLRSHSCGSHSGINAALNNGDSWEAHALDTITAGGYLNDQKAVEDVCREAPSLITRLERIGMVFTRDDRGEVGQVKFAGSSYPRTCFSNDSTGHVLLQVLFEQVLRLSIPLFHEWFATSLIVENGSCKGIYALNLRNGTVDSFSAKSVVLATGGIGRLYLPSTSALGATADGIALAYHAGAQLRDMEMVQFSPTTLTSKGILITELARGEGAYLTDLNGERFMSNYTQESMEMASRDVVARAVQTEIEKDKKSNGYAYLDFRHLDKKLIEERLPETKALVKDLTGIDLSKELVPVRPAMHRPVGGIKTDLKGCSSLNGLFAAGECANTGVHGANRLGGNSLMECLLVGQKVGLSAAERAKSMGAVQVSSAGQKEEEKRIQALVSKDSGKESPGRIRKELGLLMAGSVGIFREGKGLKKALENIKKLREPYEKLGVQNIPRYYSTAACVILELGYMLDVAETIVASASARKESRGTHYRKDFPQRNDKEWLKHTIIKQTSDEPELDYEPIDITRWSPEGGPNGS